MWRQVTCNKNCIINLHDVCYCSQISRHWAKHAQIMSTPSLHSRKKNPHMFAPKNTKYQEECTEKTNRKKPSINMNMNADKDVTREEEEGFTWGVGLKPEFVLGGPLGVGRGRWAGTGGPLADKGPADGDEFDTGRPLDVLFCVNWRFWLACKTGLPGGPPLKGGALICWETPFAWGWKEGLGFACHQDKFVTNQEISKLEFWVSSTQRLYWIEYRHNGHRQPSSLFLHALSLSMPN